MGLAAVFVLALIGLTVGGAMLWGGAMVLARVWRYVWRMLGFVLVTN